MAATALITIQTHVLQHSIKHLSTGFVVLFLKTFAWYDWKSENDRISSRWLNVIPAESWISHGYHMDITWISHGYHMDITWISHGYHMDITWISHGYHMDIMVLFVYLQWITVQCFALDHHRHRQSISRSSRCALASGSTSMMTKIMVGYWFGGTSWAYNWLW